MISAFNSFQKSILWKIIPIAIAVPFLINTITGSFQGNKNNKNYLVNFSDESYGIPYSEFQKSYQQQYNYLLRQYGAERFAELFTPDLEKLLKEQTLNGLIDERLLILYADKIGIVVSDEEVAEAIRQIPQFQIDGKYSEDRVKFFLRQLNLTVTDYFGIVRSQIRRDKVSAYLNNSFYTVPREIETVAQLAIPSAEIQYAEVNAQDFIDDITPTEEQLKEYYNSNKINYEVPAEATFSYILYSKDELLKRVKEPTNAELEAYYKDNESLYKTDTYDLSDIIVNSAKDASIVIDELKAGKPFAEVAKTYSQDLASKDVGGKLGVLSPQDLPKKLAEIAGLMNEESYSQPVNVDGSYHILYLNKKEFKVTSFAQAKTAIKDKLYTDAKNKYIEEIRQELKDIVDSKGSIQESAKVLDLPVVTTKSFTLKDVPEPLNEATAKLAFNGTLQVGQATNPQALGDKEVVLQVDKFKETTFKPFEEVKEDVAKAKRLEIAQNRERDRLNNLANYLNEHPNLPEKDVNLKLGEYNIKLSELRTLSIYTPGQDNAPFYKSLFTSRFNGNKEDYTVVSIDDQHKLYFISVHGFVVDKLNPEFFKVYNTEYPKVVKEDYFSNFMQILRKDFEVDINWTMLNPSEEH